MTCQCRPCGGDSDYQKVLQSVWEQIHSGNVEMLCNQEYPVPGRPDLLDLHFAQWLNHDSAKEYHQWCGATELSPPISCKRDKLLRYSYFWAGKLNAFHLKLCQGQCWENSGWLPAVWGDWAAHLTCHTTQCATTCSHHTWEAQPSQSELACSHQTWGINFLSLLF